MEKIYDAKTDPQFSKPYVDIDRKDYRVLPVGTKVPYRYIHGGFEDTDVRFSFCYPGKTHTKSGFSSISPLFPARKRKLHPSI